VVTKEEALNLALDALSDFDYDKRLTAITAIKEALAQPAQEPVAWRYKGNLHEFDPSDWASPEFAITPLYAALPKRPWVGLTLQEAAECWTTSATQTWRNFEAKLKEKNT
jgi:hypothetical protein